MESNRRVEMQFKAEELRARKQRETENTEKRNQS